VAYGVRVHGKQGRDAFPHLDFWRGVAGLAADGAQFAASSTVKSSDRGKKESSRPFLEDPGAGNTAGHDALPTAAGARG
jgi:hypothetical protein